MECWECKENQCSFHPGERKKDCAGCLADLEELLERAAAASTWCGTGRLEAAREARCIQEDEEACPEGFELIGWALPWDWSYNRYSSRFSDWWEPDPESTEGHSRSVRVPIYAKIGSSEIMESKRQETKIQSAQREAKNQDMTYDRRMRDKLEKQITKLEQIITDGSTQSRDFQPWCFECFATRCNGYDWHTLGYVKLSVLPLDDDRGGEKGYEPRERYEGE